LIKIGDEMLKLGFLGPQGTFSHNAAIEYSKEKPEYQLIEYNTIPELMLAVSEGALTEAIVPIENSLEGAVTSTLDMFVADLAIYIKAEIIIPISLNLLVKAGTTTSQIKEILSHPQPFGQSRKYLTANFSNVDMRPVASTAAAAEEVSKSDGQLAALGSELAGELYGLTVLARDIQDGKNNFTRFVVISQEKAVNTSHDKTAIVFSTGDEPGSLYRILDILNIWDVNMTRIESRPSKEQLGKYIFYVDIVGNQEEADIRDALAMVRRKTSFFKVLGSYPIYYI
jgi:prephenate dehydratase